MSKGKEEEVCPQGVVIQKVNCYSSRVAPFDNSSTGKGAAYPEGAEWCFKIGHTCGEGKSFFL